MQHRHERYRPLLVTIVANAAALALLILQDGPVVMKLLAVMSLIEVVIISTVTLYWQISMHTMAITGATMAVGVLLSLPLALLMTPLIVLVGAARLRLDRHTPMQVFAGAMVGAFAPVILFLMVLLI
jgi:membrane-associated phospholipid phosphatase